MVDVNAKFLGPVPMGRFFMKVVWTELEMKGDSLAANFPLVSARASASYPENPLGRAR